MAHHSTQNASDSSDERYLVYQIKRGITLHYVVAETLYLYLFLILSRYANVSYHSLKNLMIHPVTCRSYLKNREKLKYF